MAAEGFLSVAEIDGRGRGLVSTQPLKAGQTVLRDSPILLYSAFPFQNPSSYCNHCFRTLQSSSINCSSCSALFCSAACLSSATSSSHSPYVCQSLTRLSNSPHFFLNHPLERQLQSRFLIAAYNLSLVSPSKFQILLSFQGIPSANDSSAAEFLHSLISSLCPPPPDSAPFSLELTAILLAKDRLNAFGLMEPFNDGQRSVRAYGLYPMASLFNHDCLPNACRFDYVDAAVENENNTDIIVRMIHDVPQGREICLSYFPVNLDYAARQKRLLEDYGFACDCDRCKVEANWSDNENETVDEKQEEEEAMEEDEDEEMAGSENENEESDFPHAYFFMRYMCDGPNCWGTMAPLPPSDVSPLTVMECNVCGKFKNDIVEGGENLSMDD
ncbi:histone-lysine N-methyltransferase ASHR2-like [Mangifera indica]|uniref:histone-lysine N-methyltransferase ASHR2-like n=1 Tax=Mangifera indica TaxID=29780 RepID=UPI001CFBA243|nr:histone-lysine N-methyltransferase ASHR2-like [Mangifera indica]